MSKKNEDIKKILRMIANDIEPIENDDVDGKELAGELRDIAEKINIDIYELEEQMSEQPGLYAFPAASAEIWNATVSSLDFESKVMAAAIDEEIRHKEMSKSNPGKLTENAIKAQVTVDKRYKDIIYRKLDAQTIAGVFIALARAIKDRKELMIEISLNQARQRGMEGMMVQEEKAKQVVRRSKR